MIKSNSKPKAADNAPLHERAYAELRRALMSGQLLPGQKVTLRGLAAMLGTSDMPIRAALVRLVAEGGMVQHTNGTFSVPIASRESFRQVMELRAVVEGYATGLSCKHIDKAGIENLHLCAEKLSQAVDANNIIAYLHWNQ